MGPDKTIHQSNSTKSTSNNYKKYANKNCNNDTNSTKGYTHYGFTRSNSEHDRSGRSTSRGYYMDYDTVQKDTSIMVLQEAIVNMIEVDDQRLEDTTWTTIEYKNKSIFTQYVLNAHAFLKKYLNKWK